MVRGSWNGLSGSHGKCRYFTCQEHGIFRTFYLFIFMTFALLLPSPHSFHSVSLSRKDKTRAIDYNEAEHSVQLQWTARFKKLSKRPSLWIVYKESISPSSLRTISLSRTSPSSPDRGIVGSRRYPPPTFAGPLSWPAAIQQLASLPKSSTKEWYLGRSITV